MKVFTRLLSCILFGLLISLPVASSEESQNLRFLATLVSPATISIASDNFPECGLYYYHPTLNKRLNLPLKSITYNVEINEAIATVELIQYYYNDQDVNINTEYNFPISDNAVFNKFSAQIGEKVIKGEIKKKEEAKQIYAQQQAAGNTVAYSEITAGLDVMKIQIGNLLSKQEIMIKFSYLEHLEVSLNKFWKFTINSTLVPRYTPQGSTNTVSVSTTTQKTFPWYVNVNINSKNPIETLRVPSHTNEVVINTISPTNKKIQFNSSNLVYPNKDYYLYFSVQNQFSPKAVLEKHPTIASSYVGSIEFFPTFNQYTDDVAFGYISQLMAGTTYIPELMSFDQKYSKNEFIFILDQSGSMADARITNVKNTMQSLLDFLPDDSYFNIYGFGSTYNKWYIESVNVRLMRADAKIKLNSLDANLGGTEILQPLQAAIGSPIISNRPKIVYLLTDGQVSNSDQIIAYAKSNTNVARVFAVGIGNGVSNYLIKNLGIQGLGGYDYVKDTDNLTDKTKSMIYKMITPFLNNFSVEFTSPGVVSQTVTPASKLAFLAKNEPFKFYFILNGAEFEKAGTLSVTIGYFNSYSASSQTSNFQIKLSDAQTSDVLHKLVYKKIIDDNKFNSEKLSDDAIVNISLKYQVLCESTAFIVVIQENANSTAATQTTTISNQQSVDYSQNASASGGISLTGAAIPAIGISTKSTAITSGSVSVSGASVSGASVSLSAQAAPAPIAQPANAATSFLSLSIFIIVFSFALLLA